MLTVGSRVVLSFSEQHKRYMLEKCDTNMTITRLTIMLFCRETQRQKHRITTEEPRARVGEWGDLCFQFM